MNPRLNTKGKSIIIVSLLTIIFSMLLLNDTTIMQTEEFFKSHDNYAKILLSLIGIIVFNIIIFAISASIKDKSGNKSTARKNLIHKAISRSHHKRMIWSIKKK